MMNNDGNVAQPMTGHAGHAGHSMQASNTQGEHAMFGVKGACDMCKQRIEDTAKSIKGVSSAIWDKNTQTIHLQFDPKQTSVDAIAKAIAAAGHDNDKYKADQNVYDKLPACCHYRK